MKRQTRLIIALDVLRGEDALRIAGETAHLCDAFKVNYPLVLSSGIGIVDRLAELGEVLCDFKVADVPHTNRAIVELVFEHAAAGIIVHGFPGEDSLQACLNAARGEVFVLALMSHPGADRYMVPLAEEIAAMARDRGAAGIVAGATRPETLGRLREVVGDLLILSPGVGPQGGDPRAALKHGADHLIVGRRIVEAADPAKAAAELVEEVRGL